MKAPTIPEGISIVRHPRRGVLEATCTHRGCHVTGTMAEGDQDSLRCFFERHEHRKDAHAPAP